MKKPFAVMTVVCGMLWTSVAEGALLNQATVLSEIDVNSSSTLVWTDAAVGLDTGGTLVWNAFDQRLTLPSFLSDSFGNLDVSHTITITLDGDGVLQAGGTLVEKALKAGGLDFDGDGFDDFTYAVNDILLSGTILAFGWSDILGTGSSAKVDYLIDKATVAGTLVDSAAVAWSTANHTFASTDKANVSFSHASAAGIATFWDADKNFTLTQTTGFKAVVPAPGAALLAGIGLMMSRRIRRRKTA